MVDMAKGVGIILVVYGHCLRGLISAGVVPQDSPIIITDYIIYTFHMPLFFVASGFFFEKSLQRSNRDFWRKQLNNILYPYFFWSLLCGFIQIILSGSAATNSRMTASRLSEILWNPISPFWFLYALFFCYAISLLLKSISIIVRIITGLLIFITSFYVAKNVFSDIFYGFTYFSLGILIQKKKLVDLIPARCGTSLVLVIMFFVTAFVSYYLRIPERMPFIAAIMGIIATVTICRMMEYKSSSNPILKTLSVLGQYSMSIYVMHIIVIVSVRTVLVKFFMVKSIPTIMIPAILCGLFFPYLVQRILIYLNINNLFGLPFSARN